VTFVTDGDLRVSVNLHQQKTKNSSMNIEQLIKENNCTIVDVRTPGEFMSGHVSGSVNIPLNEIPRRMEELRGFKQPLVLCCASGGRSGNATAYLSDSGMDCYNAGSWLDVNYLQGN
jgi:rhodanese-related sulfurtransferase